MSRFEYKAIPAPTSGTKAKGVKTTEDRFALAITDSLNEMAVEGWEYVRAETLPCDERKGLTGTLTTFQNILVFRRPLTQPLALTPSQPVAEMVEPEAYDPDGYEPEEPRTLPTLSASRDPV